MEQKNSQELDTKIFSDFIYDPSAISASDTEVLADMIDKYPYTQLLRSFYTRSLVDSHSSSFGNSLTKAALFSPDGAILRMIIEDPDTFKSKTRESDFKVQDIMGSADPIRIADTNEEEEIELYTNDLQTEEETEIFEEVEETVSDSSEEEVEEQIFEETIVDDRAEEEVGNILATDPVSTALNQTKATQDQLVSTQGDFEHDRSANLVENPEMVRESEDLNGLNEEEALDLLIKQNAASADYLDQNRESDTELDITEDAFTPENDIAENITHNAVLEDRQKVSRYDDDKMPYSFLWWLSKTRMEHADSYQPYVNFQLDTSQNIKRNTVDQLSTQIIENIFHLQSPVDDLENAPKTVPFQVKRKEDFILEKFIREEPQIKPPKSDRLDNENKARKSAEDPNDLVSETLANIYTDQMLFHKAIETYKKLSLKFPEKSTYFADQIRELEKKIN